jgi:hypothetical protein
VKKTLVIPLAGLTLLVLAGVGILMVDRHVGDSLDNSMATHAKRLIPGGRIISAEVTDDPALLAVRRERVQQTMVSARTADDKPVLMILREYNRDTRQAQSVSWQVGGIQLAPGWTAVMDERGVALNKAYTQIDGHRITVSAKAEVSGDTLTVAPATLSIDGREVPISGAPSRIRTELRTLEVRTPLPGAHVVARAVWFDEYGVGVDLYGRNVHAN